MLRLFWRLEYICIILLMFHDISKKSVPRELLENTRHLVGAQFGIVFALQHLAGALGFMIHRGAAHSDLQSIQSLSIFMCFFNE